MNKVFALLIGIAFYFSPLSHSHVQAGVIIDFESTGFEQGDAVTSHSGVSFTNALFVTQGDPTFAFSSPFGGDTGDTGSFAQSGNAFIVAGPTDDHNELLTMDFTALGTVSDLSFNVVDIDVNDVFTATAFDSDGGTLETLVLDASAADPGTGDGVVTSLSFSVSGIATVSTLNSRVADAGHGIDNISFTAVPEPSSFTALGLAALCLFCGRRARGERVLRHNLQWT